MQVTVHNRGPEAAHLHVLPQLWARNIWSWQPDSMRPQLVARGDQFDLDRSSAFSAVAASLRRPAGIPVLRKRHQCAAALGHGRAGPLLQGRHQRLHRQWRSGGGEPGAPRNQGRGALSARSAGGREPRGCARASRLDGPASGFAGFDGYLPSAGPRPTNFMPSCSGGSPIPMPGWCSARHLPACCGRSSFITSTFPNG